MNKQTIIAIVLCVGILLLWDLFFMKKPEPPSLPDGGVASLVQNQMDGQTTSENHLATENQATTGVEPKKTEPTTPPLERPQEKLTVLKTDSYESTWTSRGGNLKNFVLKDYLAVDADMKAIKDKREDLVSAKEENLMPFRISFVAEKTDFKLPAYTDWEVVESSDRKIVFRYADATDNNTPIITKTYSVSENDFVLDLEIKIANRAEKSIKEQIQLEISAAYTPPVSSGCFGAPTTPRMPVCKVNEEVLTIDPTAANSKSGEPRVYWAGINEQYFLMAAIPLSEEKAFCNIEATSNGILKAIIRYPEKAGEEEIALGGSKVHNFRLFIGPKRLNLLENIKGGIGAKDQNARLTDAVDFGWLGFLCHPMLWLLKTFFAWVGNYGIAIIVLTILIKLVTLPLNQKVMKSQRRMTALKPMMEDLKKKYANDKQRLNQETMALFKSHKVNPMGGCFPMLVQLPIWMALYRMLYSSVELYQTTFISGWIDDLAYRDPYYIMPLVLGVGMFLQQKLSPTTVDTQQAKMMLYFMPIFFTFIMLFCPSGLVLYILVNSALSIGHQILYNRLNPVPQTTPGKPRLDGAKG